MRLACLAVALAVATAAHAGHRTRAEREAAAHVDRGLALMGEGRFEEAIAEFTSAQALDPHPENTQHIGECQEALGRTLAAVASYQHYLAEAGDPPDAAATRKHVTDLAVAFHVGEGKRYLDDKEYEKALHEYEEAEKARHDPKRDYDLAVCLEGMGETGRAIAAYEAYLKEVPDAADAGEVEGRLKVLRGQRMAPPPQPAKDALAPPPTAPRWYTSKGGWAMVGAAALLAAGSGASFGLAGAAGGDADGAHAEADFLAAQDRGRALGWASLGMGVAAGVALVAAVVLFVVHGRAEAK